MNIYSLIASSLIIFLVLFLKAKTSKEISEENFYKIVFFTFLSSILGAKIFHILENWFFYLNHFELLELSKGYSILGAISFGIVTLKFLEMRIKISLREIYINLFLLLPLIQTIGRIGNITNNELLPFSYYEMILNLINFLILCIISYKKREKIVYLYFLNYGLIRIFIESLKGNLGFLFFISIIFTIYGFLGIFKLRLKV